MKVTKTKNLDGTSQVILNEVTDYDLKHLYIRTSLSNSAINKATMTEYNGEIVSGFNGKTVPEPEFGCEFAHIFKGVWDD